MAVLDVTLVKRFPEFELNLAFTIEAGVLVLFGPSGAGKSLTIQMIAGLVNPDQGLIRVGNRILFDGSAAISRPPQHRHIGYVPQQYAIFPHLTVAENVAFPLYKGRRRLTKREALNETSPLLEQFGLKHRAEARPAELSGGQIQRVAFARSLVTQPEVLLLDEPFAALDTPVRSELRGEFKRIQRELGIPAVFITHDLEEAALIADELAILIDGRIRQAGRTRTVLDVPVDPAVAELVQSRNVLPGCLTTNIGTATVTTEIGQLRVGRRFAGGRKQVSAVIRPEKIRIIREDTEIPPQLSENLLSGTITGMMDHGTYTAVVCRVGSGELEVSLSPTAAARLHLAAGKSVRLSIPSDWIHIISTCPGQ